MNSIIEKIKSDAYWRVNIRPLIFKKDRIPNLTSIKKIIEECKVSLRGWSYPQINPKDLKNGEDWVHSKCDWKAFVEYWRFYQSGQFIHYFSFPENYYLNRNGDEEIKMVYSQNESYSGYVGILQTLFRMTEIFEFAMRISQKIDFETGLKFSIKLKGIKYRKLKASPMRFLHNSYISDIDEINLDFNLGVEELFAKGYEEAINKTIHIFERFNWDDPPRDVLIIDQKKLLERKL